MMRPEAQPDAAPETQVSGAASVSAPVIDQYEAFDRMHDGGVIIDPRKCALTLYVDLDGNVGLNSPYSAAQVAELLVQLAENMTARAEAEIPQEPPC